MKKQSLVVVHSFPTNSILLGGLIEYLDQFFDTHFIDLPGFTKDSPPLERISLEGFTRFVQTKIAELELDSYIAAGVSFGFLVVNNLAVDEKCQGILGIVPYLGQSSLRMRTVERWFWATTVRTISLSGLSSVVWNSFIVRGYFRRIKQYREEVYRTIIKHVDAKTFFDTAWLLLSRDADERFGHPVYVLLPSRSDKTLDYQHICQTARGNHIHVIGLDIDHYPQDLSRSYFERAIPPQVIDQLQQVFAAGVACSREARPCPRSRPRVAASREHVGASEGMPPLLPEAQRSKPAG